MNAQRHSGSTLAGERPFHFSYLDQEHKTSAAGAKSHIFQPPRTPSASSSLYSTRLTSSAMSGEYTHISNAGRKRSRQDYNDGRQTPTREEEMFSAGTPASPMPFVNTRYVLKGGMDTPTALADDRQEMAASQYSDVGYRRELSGTKDLLGEESSGYQSFLPLDLDDDENNKSGSNSRRSSAQNGEGWTKVAYAVGGVVGKVWEFCKKGAFKGFYAGAGKGYTVNNLGDSHFAVEETPANFWGEEKITTAWDNAGNSTPLPGKFPEEDFIPNYLDNITPDGAPERPGKRRQISANFGDDLAKNWVVVPTGNTPSKPAPAPRGPARYSMQTASSNSRRSVASRPASRATGPLAVARRPMLPRVSHAGSPTLSNLQGASFASPRSPGGKIPRAIRAGSPSPSKALVGADSPAAQEAQRWAKMKMREDREADVTIRRLDAQMKAMIREAKEALGTKIEVDIQDDDPPAPITPRRSKMNIKKWGV